jgi:hypothetical protein
VLRADSEYQNEISEIPDLAEAADLGNTLEEVEITCRLASAGLAEDQKTMKPTAFH